MDIVDRIFRTLSRWGSFPAFVELKPGSAPLYTSAHQFLDRCDTLESRFRTLGVAEGVAVALFLGNSVDFIAVFVTLLRMRALVSAIKLEFRRTELDEIFSNFDPDVVVCEESHRPVVAAYEAGRTVVVRGTDGRLRQEVAGRLHERPEVPDGVVSINYTYRGYGYPIGAMIRPGAYEAGADFILSCLQARPGDRSLVILPMPHIFTLVGSLFVPIFGRMTAVIAQTLHPRHLISYLNEMEINFVTSVPEIYHLLRGFLTEETRPAALRSLVSGGSRLDAEMHTAVVDAFGCEVLHGYGLTEYAIVSAPPTGTSRPGTVGVPAPGLQCRVEADGELSVSSPHIAAGYYRRPRESGDAIADGWFATGDIVEQSDGYLRFVHEKKGTCKVNGNMVDLVEVERAAATFPGVAGVEVAAEGGSLRAEVAFSAEKGPADNQERAKNLRRHLFGIISSHKVPKTIVSTNQENQNDAERQCERRGSPHNVQRLAN
ncbi:class I adenylate-forming enzyme family protein [Salinispira pacifica]